MVDSTTTATTLEVPSLTATDSTTTDSTAADGTASASATATNDDVLSPAVANDVTNRNLGIGLGVGIGGVAALGLAGLLLYNHRNKQQQQQSMMDGEEQVNTRWRTQSFMGVVASVVSKLPRSGSLRSKLSNTTSSMVGPGMAYTTDGAPAADSASSPPPPLADAPPMDYQHRY
jgi:hypothetical protein